MQINNNNKNKKRQQDISDDIEEEDIEIKRDLELENIAGNLMIAEYQVDKLRRRLSQQVRDSVYHSFSNIKTSAHTFKYDGKWYKVSIKVEEVSLDGNNNAVKSQD
ncbi:MAG: hypothetical protein ACJ71G_13420 [Nitrososphaeraceae archaeon]